MEADLLTFASSLLDGAPGERPLGDPVSHGERALLSYVLDLANDEETLADDLEESPTFGSFGECPPGWTLRQTRANDYLFHMILMDPAYRTTFSNSKTSGGPEAMKLGSELFRVGKLLAALLETKNKTSERTILELERFVRAGRRIHREIRSEGEN